MRKLFKYLAYFYSKVDTKSLRLAAVVLQQLYSLSFGDINGPKGVAHTESYKGYRGLRHLWEVLREVRLTPQESEHIECVVFAVGEVFKGIRPAGLPLTSQPRAQTNRAPERDSGGFEQATSLHLLSHEYSIIVCGFDPVSAFTRCGAWFSALPVVARVSLMRIS